MKSSKQGILTLFLVLVVQLAFAQEMTVTGTVTDNNGAPLPGVNIIERGTNNGTQTDFDGKYSIKTSQGEVLVFSYVGFTKTIATVDKSEINVSLQEDAAVLEEVVVTGVASGTSKRKLGVSVNSVKSEDLQAQGAQSIDQALQGKIAGAVIQSTSGQPGQQQSIVLRAIGSLNSSQPMILIDGVQVSTSESSVGGESNLSSRLSDIDFSNVERVETISGAAAGTIYGAQGANGVINIITQKGNIGAPKVTIRSNVGFSSAITGNDMRRATLHHYTTNAEGFLINLATGDPVTTLNDNSQYLAIDPNERDVNGTALGSAGINDTPFAEKTFKATDVLFNDAINTAYGVTVSGGSEGIRYLVSGNRSEQESVLVQGKYIKYDARLNLNFNINDKIKVNTRFDIINSSNDTGTNTDNANSSNLISNVFQNLPHVDFFNRNSDGDLTVSPDATDPNSSNPFFYREIQTRLDKITRYLASFDLVYKPIDILSLNFKYGYDAYTQNFTFFQENKITHLQASSISPNVSGILNHIDNQEYFQNLLLSANLTLDFDKDLKLGVPITSTTTFNFDWRDRELRQTDIQGTNLPAGSFGSFNVNQAVVKKFNSFLEEPFRTYGFLINQKFDYKSLFGFSAGFRQDFSNRFGSGLDFTFPRADAYFNIADLFESDIASTFKLRAAYGEAGIQPLFSQNLFTFALTTVGTEAISSIPSTVSNPLLEVEISKEFEFGVDYVFTPTTGRWLSRADGSINYFDRKTEGAIFDLGIPTSTGSSAIFANAYDISSDGIEASLNLAVYKSDKFNWDFGLRYTKSTAILDRIDNGLPVVVNDNFVLSEGQEIGIFSVFPVITSLDAVDNSGNRIIPQANVDNFTVASSGYVVNKNTGNVVIGPDKVIAGSTQPDFILTFLNDFSFNDFVSLSVQLDWFQGIDVYNNSKQWLYNNALHADTAVPVTIEDPTGTNQTGAFVGYYTSLYNTNVPTSHFVEDASFLRVRDISVRFKLKNLLDIKFVEQLNLSVSGRNLFTITDYSGLDPEAARGFGNTFQRGFDEFTHPNTKSFNLGLNVTF